MIGRSLNKQVSLHSGRVWTVITPGPPLESFWIWPTNRGVIGTSMPHARQPIAFILSTASEGKSLGADKGSSRQKSSAARYSSSGASFHFPYLCCFVCECEISELEEDQELAY